MILQQKENPMRYKGLSFCFALLALVLFMGTTVLAGETQQGEGITAGVGETQQSKGITAGVGETHQGKNTAASAGETQQGKVIVAGAGKLTMEDMKGNMQYTHEVASNAEVMCEGKKCGLSDVKMGDLVKVTLDKQGDKTVVTRIEVKKADSAS